MAKSIKTSRGMLVFGSALLRVAPDVAVINLSVATAHGSPEDAFEETRKNARSVREFLARAKIDDVDSSRISLTQDMDLGSRRRSETFIARVSCNVIVDRLRIDYGRGKDT